MLLIMQMHRKQGFTENIIYEKLLSDKLPANLGKDTDIFCIPVYLVPFI